MFCHKVHHLFNNFIFNGFLFVFSGKWRAVQLDNEEMVILRGKNYFFRYLMDF